ncbi:hypothetical protein [Sediminicoccus sp. KRV36]|uniref:hypothetical protein n=1 Tax=Sediminicoccus sp. KRV36 TaxID=3133721 RepID=UPI00200D89AB|nr:hypothetical protein [Sediminicoccus rosea]UPY35510.1 hypothetical protein LHU95_14925 [Sediminicoccus rosea]
MRLSEFATNVAQSTQAAVLDFIAEHGRAHGLHEFARAVGVSERRARSLAEGNAGRIDACEYLAAQQARAALLRARISRAQHNLNLIEALHAGVDLELHQLGVLRAGPMVDLGRGGCGEALSGLDAA